ncbi:MAG: hypothetical protein HAW62_05705 [Endozoicomonadaceae bacterium]|nr:hypothetical protein [Endozoicomonadaceae bacterium]
MCLIALFIYNQNKFFLWIFILFFSFFVEAFPGKNTNFSGESLSSRIHQVQTHQLIVASRSQHSDVLTPIASSQVNIRSKRVNLNDKLSNICCNGQIQNIDFDDDRCIFCLQYAYAFLSDFDGYQHNEFPALKSVHDIPYMSNIKPSDDCHAYIGFNVGVDLYASNFQYFGDMMESMFYQSTVETVNRYLLCNTNHAMAIISYRRQDNTGWMIAYDPNQTFQYQYFDITHILTQKTAVEVNIDNHHAWQSILSFIPKYMLDYYAETSEGFLLFNMINQDRSHCSSIKLNYCAPLDADIFAILMVHGLYGEVNISTDLAEFGITSLQHLRQVMLNKQCTSHHLIYGYHKTLDALFYQLKHNFNLTKPLSSEDELALYEILSGLDFNKKSKLKQLFLDENTQALSCFLNFIVELADHQVLSHNNLQALLLAKYSCGTRDNTVNFSGLYCAFLRGNVESVSMMLSCIEYLFDAGYLTEDDVFRLIFSENHDLSSLDALFQNNRFSDGLYCYFTYLFKGRLFKVKDAFYIVSCLEKIQDHAFLSTAVQYDNLAALEIVFDQMRKLRSKKHQEHDLDIFNLLFSDNDSRTSYLSDASRLGKEAMLTTLLDWPAQLHQQKQLSFQEKDMIFQWCLAMNAEGQSAFMQAKQNQQMNMLSIWKTGLEKLLRLGILTPNQYVTVKGRPVSTSSVSEGTWFEQLMTHQEPVVRHERDFQRYHDYMHESFSTFPVSSMETEL